MFTESSRFSLVKDFLLKKYGVFDILIDPMRSDAGLRKYYRINISNSSYILMDCQLISSIIDPFIRISNFLRESNFSAPSIFFYDKENHLLLIDDFGNTNIKDYLISINRRADVTEKLRSDVYLLIVDLLIKLQKTECNLQLEYYDSPKMFDGARLFLEWYIKYRAISLSSKQIDDFENIWTNIFDLLNGNNLPNTIILRDYHVENLMYIENLPDIKSIGLLDFQDALYGSPIYDLVSILQDARIPVDTNFAESIIKHYAHVTKFDIDKVMLHYYILGTQRSMRILGVFARKFLRDNDDRYLSYIDLVISYLKYNLSYNKLSALKNWINQNNILGND